MNEQEICLQVCNLKTYYDIFDGTVKAIDDVSLTVYKGETLGIVGESGSGKSTIGLSIMKLIPQPGKIVDGKILFNGQDLMEKSEKEMEEIRGKQIAMIYQDPMTALNPVLRIGEQISEALIKHENLSKEEGTQRAIESMKIVLIPSPEERVKNYPHQFSGGMRQRVVMAMALACNPNLIIADEPTSMIDLVSQAQILKLFKDLTKKLGVSMIYITHDLGIVAELCDRIAVTYAGKIVEVADVYTIFNNPRHPYTEGLLGSIPRIDEPTVDLKTIEGSIPDLINPPTGCRFWPRCPYTTDQCKEEEQKLTEIAPHHETACIRVHEIWEKER
jgi:oligopeptide/dipeptide ABC transporter ATP-binding protein